MAKRPKDIKDESIDNRKVIVGAIKRYLRRHHRGESMDRVLSRPCDAVRMGITIAIELQMLSNPGRARALAADAKRYAEQTPADVAAIHRVLQTGMGARKAGRLRIADYVRPEGE